MVAPRPRQQRGAQTVHRVLDAALAAFAAHGLAGVTTEELTRRAGASVGSIYHHFGDRAGVVTALYRRVMESLLAEVTRAVLARRTARRGVEALVRAYLGWVAAHRDEARFLYIAGQTELAARDDAKLAAWKRELVAPLLAWLAPFVARGEVVEMPAAYYEVVIIGPVAELARRWLAGAPGLELDRGATVLAAAVWRALEPR